jgi:hypothetical protein
VTDAELGISTEPRTAEEELAVELDWFWEVTGRPPAVVRCSTATIRLLISETPRTLAPGVWSFAPLMPFAQAVVYAGWTIPLEIDRSLPLGSWRAE